MTKSEWDRVQEALESFWKVVRLNIDGYQVSLSLVRVGTYKNAIAIYINGVFKSEWLINECEERKRFLSGKERSLFTARTAGYKKLPKKEQKEFEQRYNKKYTYYESHWSSFGALKRHLIKNNTSIELESIK